MGGRFLWDFYRDKHELCIHIYIYIYIYIGT